MASRIWLSPPDVGDRERTALLAAFDSGWIAPAGPDLDAFEADLAATAGRSHSVAVSSGTAALHLALIAHGIGSGDRVLVQSLTFAATANAVMYVGAEPIFVDSGPVHWNVDPSLVEQAIDEYDPAAVIAVDLYGQPADYQRLGRTCADAGVLLISDAAESLGATYDNQPSGSFGDVAILSFNGNKVITTSGGGAVVTDDEAVAQRVRSLSTQARLPVTHYEHEEVGYNYRMSNLLAALGRAQLAGLSTKVAARREHRHLYEESLGDLPGVAFMPELDGARSSWWLTAFTIDPTVAGTDRDAVIAALAAEDIEARPVWKPMHEQPVFDGRTVVGGEFSSRLFAHGMCLPSGSSLSETDRGRVIDIVRSVLAR